MAAALTIATIFAVSIAVVQIASVAMRLTGLPDSVARFQCISALTGTGYTTHESEMIVNYPIRRCILIVLMIVGNLSLVSIAATFIVAFVDAGQSQTAIVQQVITIGAAIAITLLVLTNRTLDRAMCDFIGFVLAKTTSLAKRRYQRTLQLDNGVCVAEHILRGPQPQRAVEALLVDKRLIPLGVRAGRSREFRQFSSDHRFLLGDILVCYGSDLAHNWLEDFMADLEKEQNQRNETR